MKRRILSILATATMIFLMVSCSPNLKSMDEGDINHNIYPYLKFELSEERTYFTATVVEGAKVTKISVPGEFHTAFDSMPVGVFKGFENPEDAANLETITLDYRVGKIEEGALDSATRLMAIRTIGPDGGSLWADIPPLKAPDGYHFLGWMTDDGVYISPGMPVDPEHSYVNPVFEEHKYEIHEGKEPTCTEKGWKEYGVCSVCGHSTYTELPPLGHDMSHVERIEPSCREEGTIEHYLCLRCGGRFTDEEGTRPVDDLTLPKAGHALYYVEAKEATCMEEGNASHYRCHSCGGYFLDGDGTEEVGREDVVIAVSSHVMDGEGWKYNGVNHYHECMWCHEAIDVEAHASDGGRVKVHPTLHEPGVMEYSCTVCSYTWEEDIEEGDHDPVYKETVEPTCTERGYDIFVCGNEDCSAEVRDNYRDPLGHDAEYIGKVYATCTEDGTEAHYRCSRCGGLFWNSEATEEVDPSELVITRTGHSFDEETWMGDPNHHWHPCTNTDKNTGEKCDARGDETLHSYSMEIASLSTLRNAANCTEKAQYWKSCECGAVSKTEWFEYGEPLGHDITFHQSNVDATCTVDGYEEFWYCQRCGKYFSDSSHTVETTPDDSRIPALGHDWQWRSDPEQHWKECSRCHEKIEDSYGSHNYITEDGTTRCTVCGYRVVTGEGGFTPIIVDRRPIAHLVCSNEGTEFTFTLVNDKEEYPPTQIEWYLEDRLQEKKGWSFTFDAPYPMTYKVMCVYSNDHGRGSQTMVVNGG